MKTRLTTSITRFILNVGKTVSCPLMFDTELLVPERFLIFIMCPESSSILERHW